MDFGVFLFNLNLKDSLIYNVNTFIYFLIIV